MANIIQWNCRGLRANYNELDLLLSRWQPVAVCLQEIIVPESFTNNNRHYSLFKKCATDTNGQPIGGVGILVNKRIPHSEIKIDTSIEAVAVRISTKKLSPYALYIYHL